MAVEARTFTDASATMRYLRSSPQKVRLVVDLLRGKPVTEALSILKFSDRMVARDLGKLLHSAVANAEQTDVGDLEELYLASAVVDCGPSQKRIRPAPMGRAFRYLHRTSHVTFRLARIEGGATKDARAPRQGAKGRNAKRGRRKGEEAPTATRKQKDAQREVKKDAAAK